MFSEILNNEIVIDGNLYNYIFGSNIDWEKFMINYQYGIDSGNYLTGKLSNLGKTVNILIKDSNGRTIIDLSNKKNRSKHKF